MNATPSTPLAHDPAELERRRAEAYRQIPLLRQQALEETARWLAGLWRAFRCRVAGRSGACGPARSPEALRA